MSFLNPLKKIPWNSGVAVGFLTAVFFSLIGTGELSARSLPQWSPEDRVLLEKGQLVAGASLFMDDADRPPRAVVVSEDQEDTVPKTFEPSDDIAENDPNYDATLIAEKYLHDYFTQSPQSYLIDPQRLFSNQETLDREGFLAYYADESEVDVRIYLFDANQNLPAPYSLERLVKEQYADGPLTAVVFYFLGNPKRNQLRFGGKNAELVNSDKLRKMLDLARVKAMEKSDPSTQMESFIVQLSISIYWMEQEIADRQAAEKAEMATASSEKTEHSSNISRYELIKNLQPYLLYGVVGVLSVISIVMALLTGWVLWSRSRRYTFPVLDLPRRLGADYAAGIGAVIGFHNKLDSPSDQCRKVPEYLTRI